MIAYRTSLAGITPDRLEEDFFEGWPNPPDPERHLAILQGSDHVVLAVEEATERVVGFVTALTDGVLMAYIPLLEVLPEYRGRGIGSDLVRHLLAEIGDLYAVDAMCDPELQPFYAHLGLRPASGVMLRNYAAQRGAPGQDPAAQANSS